MDEAALVQLAIKAIGLHGTTGCCEFVSDALQNRIRAELGHLGTPRAIKAMMVQFVMKGGAVEFRQETRPEYQDRREYWFRVNVPIAGFPNPLFFELEMNDHDLDCPSVTILNVHF